MNRFKEIYKETLKWEGGDKLHNVSGDSGGWTKFGISYNNNKKHFKSLEDFKNMTFEKASEVAYDNYYKPLHLESVQEESKAMLFDIAFNMGVKRAVILAQRALNIPDDGIIGKQTIAAFSQLCKVKLNAERVKYFNSIVKNNPTQSKFLKGWLNRSEYFLKKTILLFFAIFLFTSCGSRKVVKDKESTKIEQTSESEESKKETKDIVKKEATETNTNTEEKETELVPIDESKPIIRTETIEGNTKTTTWENARVKEKAKSEQTEAKKDKSEIDKSEKTKNVKTKYVQKSETLKKSKELESKIISWWWLLLIIPILGYGYYKFK